jgi:hypothetical protein
MKIKKINQLEVSVKIKVRISRSQAVFQTLKVMYGKIPVSKQQSKVKDPYEQVKTSK